MLARRSRGGCQRDHSIPNVIATASLVLDLWRVLARVLRARVILSLLQQLRDREVLLLLGFTACHDIPGLLLVRKFHSPRVIFISSPYRVAGLGSTHIVDRHHELRLTCTQCAHFVIIPSMHHAADICD